LGGGGVGALSGRWKMEDFVERLKSILKGDCDEEEEELI
jgi:hypothetical protein